MPLRRTMILALTVFCAGALANGPAEAHLFGAHGAGFAAGLAHPFGGLDHLLAMIGVGIAISVLTLGVMIARPMKPSSAASPLLYGAGFVAATVILHATGIGLSLGLARFQDSRVPRLAGYGIGASGAFLLLAAI